MKGGVGMLKYEKYWLSRIISVQAVVSADYIEGRFPAKYYHAHQSAWELIFALSGTVEVKKDGATVLLAQNQMILLSPGIHHDIQIDDPGAKIFVLSFACSNDSYLLSVQNIPLDAEASMIPFVESMIRELTATFAPQSTRLHLIRFVPDVHSPVGAEQMICCCLEQFLILLLRETTMTQGNVASAEQFHKAFQTHLTEQITDYIHENLSGQLTVQQIAEHFHYSRARLSTLYKEATGVSISEAITNCQIQKAKEMLLKSEKSVADISEELGFSSTQYFSAKFAKIEGTPPSKYREGK
jgi:AraC-like DNA-binding protein